MIRVERRKKKVSVSVADSYQEVLSSSVPHFWTPRYLDCTLMRIMELCMMNVSPARKEEKKKIYLCLCLSLPHLSKSVKYQDTCRAAASKISWIAALVLMFGDLSAAARAVSLCKTCDTITGGHCQAGLSQRVLRKKLRHIFTGE